MAASYGSSGVRSNKAAVATTDTVTPALPAGVSAGDLLVIFASSLRDATTFAADQSYVKTRQNTKIAILEKTAGGSEVAPTVTFGGLTIGDLISAVVIRFPGGAATKDWSNVTGAASATTLPGPPLTVTDTGSVGVVIGYQPNDKTGATFTANGWTEREYSFTTTGTDGTHYVATQDGLAAGSQTMPSWAWSGGLEYRAISFSVPPAAGTQSITAALFSNDNTFHEATVSPGLVEIASTLFADPDVFHASTVTGGGVVSRVTSSGTGYSQKTLSRIARDIARAEGSRRARPILVRGIANLMGNPPQAQQAVKAALHQQPAERFASAPDLIDLAIRASAILAQWDEEDAELLLLSVA